ncbi:hypothetical protein IHE61_27075 [Streptomyces sp. GKU 257-1]|nr:hypothetical protein [Streptomyces sp. GKU 257-1]
MNRSDSGRRRWLGRRKDLPESSRPAVPAPETAGSPPASAEHAPGSGERLLVEEYDGLRLLRTRSRTTPSATPTSPISPVPSPPTARR